MKFFNTSEIRLLDQYTIEHEPIASIDLMERVAEVLFCKFLEHFPAKKPICIFAGPGNNGGDGLALARKFIKAGFEVQAILLHSGNLSTDCEKNKHRLIETSPNSFIELINTFIPPEIVEDTIIIDGLFGSGLNRPLKSFFAEAINFINQSSCPVISIDLPSGLHGEDNKITENSIIVKADLTFSLQFPKLSFFFAECEMYLGNWEIVEIGLHPYGIEQTPSDFYVLEKKMVVSLLKKHTKFAHKGTFGHGLLIAGSAGMAGASILAAKAALKSGAGLISVHGPATNRIIVQSTLPEVIFKSDVEQDFITQIENSENYSAIAVGPGIGMNKETAEMLLHLISHTHRPLVLDADALNIIAQHKDLLQHLPKNSILTPHPKEFDRLFGASSNSFERKVKARQAARIYGVTIILKGAHTLISLPDGKLFVNTTGNSGMATAGSGDVLTGILLGLLAQGYETENAALFGVYIHGLAGDLALENESKESLIARDIINSLGKTFKSIQ